jgi:hypothetical protein
MALILVGTTEVSVAESVEEAMGRIVNGRDGLRRGDGGIVAPAGWVSLIDRETDQPIFIQLSQIGYVR